MTGSLMMNHFKKRKPVTDLKDKDIFDYKTENVEIMNKSRIE